MASRLKYVIVTPARNEQDFIELTIRSMIGQTIKPEKWVIVSDGSTDRTDEIVASYQGAHPWIELVRVPPRTERHFGGKVAAFNAGYERVKQMDFDLVGSMDADISFDATYFEFLLNKFDENPKLGVGGTPFSENGKTYDYRVTSTEHVSGACQLFRRECFQAIGGYVPVKGGGIDVIAILSARMKGWETRTYPERSYDHHRPMGSANHSHLMTRFKLGEKDYILGRHPLWQTFRSVYQMTRHPFIIGGSALFAGYFWAALRRVQRPVSEELIKFQRREQMLRLYALISRAFRLRSS
jgi:poly-beta-1,6-N-acetyl-D-glucosamine synthase